MKDYSNIPFKNAAIDRLTSLTTPPPIERSYSDPTPRITANQELIKRSAEYMNLLEEKTKKAPRNENLEYKPKNKK
jgi:hypothetical protein